MKQVTGGRIQLTGTVRPIWWPPTCRRRRHSAAEPVVSTSSTRTPLRPLLVFRSATRFSMKLFLFIQRPNPLWCWLSALHKRPIGGSTGVLVEDIPFYEKKEIVSSVSHSNVCRIFVFAAISAENFSDWLDPVLRSDWRSRPLHSLHERRGSSFFLFHQKKKVFWLAHSFRFFLFCVKFCFIAKLLVSL